MTAILLLTAALLLAEDKPQLPDGPGKDVTVRICNACHGVELMIGRPHSEDGWSAIVLDMVTRGAKGSDDEFDEIVQYLTKNIKAVPKVNVNKVAAAGLESGLGLTSKEAAALVEAREKAPFKSIEDLKKVAGVDAAKIEAKKKLLSFE